MAERSNVGKRAAEDAAGPPTRPDKSLHDNRVAVLAGIECRVKAEHAAILNPGSLREQHVGGQGNGQGLRVQVLRLHNGVEMGNKEVSIYNRKNAATRNAVKVG